MSPKNDNMTGPDTPQGAFIGQAAKLTHNPLGIIGLFVALIYSAAALVSGASPYLSESQRWVLVVFSVLFPVLVLRVFYLLVTHHHSKLYAPKDWRDERNFFGPQSDAVRQERQEEAVREIVASDSATGRSVASLSTGVAPPTTGRRQSAARAPEDVYRLVREAEDLLFRRLAREYPNAIYRDVSIKGQDRNIAFDGVMTEPGRRLIGIEVKVVRNRSKIADVVRQVMKAAAAAAAASKHVYHVPFDLILGLVTQGLDSQDRHLLQKQAEELLSEASVFGARVIVADLDDLRHEFSGADSQVRS